MKKGETKAYRIGEQNINYQGIDMKIIAFRKSNDIDVLFLNGSNETKTTRYCHFISGRVRCSSATKTNKMLCERKRKKEELQKMIENGSVRNIIGSTKYFVDKEGRVFNSKGRELIPVKVCGGYYKYDITDLKNTGKSILAHRAVAQAWIPNPLNKTEVNHINGDKSDNRVENLEWVTNSENQRHRFRVLHHSHFGEKNTQSKLSKEMVLDIVRLKHEGLSLGDLSDMFSVSKTTISCIINGYSWSHITGIPSKRNIRRMKELGYIV